MKKFLPLLFLLLLVSFQNCGLPFSGSASGNGNGYGGFKVGDGASAVTQPRLFNETGPSVCADGSPTRSSILYAEGSASMIRENCADLAPVRSLNLQEIRVSGNELTYQGRTYRAND